MTEERRFAPDDLELSVRASGVLRMAGIDTIEKFMSLTKKQVMNFKNSGIKTWHEIRECQVMLATSTRAPKGLRDVEALVNGALDSDLSLHLVRSRRTGLLVFAREIGGTDG